MGLYRLSSGKKSSYFTITESIFDTDQNVCELYDLKGSVAGRSRKERKDGAPPCGPLLDRDMKRKLYFGPEVKEKFITQLRSDAEVGVFSIIYSHH